MDAVARFYAAYDGHDATQLRALLAPDYQGIVNGRKVASPAEAESFVAGFIAAFPDCKYTVLDRVDGEGKSAVRWSFAGTHRGTFAGVAATGRPAVAEGMTWFELDGPRIRRLWSQWDVAGLLARLGAP